MPLNIIFQDIPFSSLPFQMRTFGNKCCRFFAGQMPFLSPNSIKALIPTTGHHPWPDHFLVHQILKKETFFTLATTVTLINLDTFCTNNTQRKNVHKSNISSSCFNQKLGAVLVFSRVLVRVKM